jgi:hypothetical protein
MQTIRRQSLRQFKACICAGALGGGAVAASLAGCSEKPPEQAPQTIEHERDRHQEMMNRESGAQN